MANTLYNKNLVSASVDVHIANLACEIGDKLKDDKLRNAVLFDVASKDYLVLEYLEEAIGRYDTPDS